MNSNAAMHAFAKVLAPRGGRTEAAPDPRVNPAYLRGDAGRWVVLLSRAALRAHLPAHDDARPKPRCVAFVARVEVGLRDFLFWFVLGIQRASMPRPVRVHAFGEFARDVRLANCGIIR
jgi:hypothetical protein